MARMHRTQNTETQSEDAQAGSSQLDLMHRIETREAVVSVIGLGYVGLPLAVAFAEAGFRVVGVDIDVDRVDAVNRGQSYLRELASEKLANVAQDGTIPSIEAHPRAGRKGLVASSDYAALDEADVVLVCVQTPLGRSREPDLSYVVSSTDEIARRLRRCMLVVLESSTYPGTTEEVILPRLSGVGAGSLIVGGDFFLAYSPERIDPGRLDYTISNTPKVVGGVTPRCGDVAAALYKCVVDQVVTVSSPKVAETAKLLENTFRATNIALVNETAIMCDRLGVDVWEVIEAAATKPFGFMPFYPGPGPGGHCIPVDPQYLAWKLDTLDYDARLIKLAVEINMGMPAYVVGKIIDALNDSEKPLKGAQILLLGVSYKADVEDIRKSPALDILELLSDRNASVAYHDPYVPALDVGELSLTAVPLDTEALNSADCVVITTAHSSYNWQWVVENSRLVVDTRNATAGVAAGSERVVKL